ncbi:hypothetical protein [Kitasatospora sp. NPDC093102]|uniref:hypothetical protein n=1 Tax=Kitasatospora sp. NPDC093102 TaxID=3155069 RepID=UPI00341C991C
MTQTGDPGDGRLECGSSVSREGGVRAPSRTAFERWHATPVRRLVDSWLAEESGPGSVEADRAALTGGLDLPPADARSVIAAAHHLLTGPDAPGRLMLRARLELGEEGFGRLLRLSEALVVDEHPSAGLWTPQDRHRAVEAVGLLIHRYGEDGVRRLTAGLRRERTDGDGPDAGAGAVEGAGPGSDGP